MSTTWSIKTLGEFFSIQRGHDLTWEERKDGNIPVFGAAGLNGYHDKALAKAPGIVIGRSGGSFGKAYLVEEDFWPHNTALYVTDFKGNDPYFTYYLIKTIDFTSLNSGSAQPSLNRNFIYPQIVRVPDPRGQKQIGAVLRSIDRKIALNNRINAELEALAKTIYDYWFVQFDFPDENGRPYKASGGEIVYNEVLKREVPAGWEVKSLFEAVEVQYGFPFSTAFFNDERRGYPVIRIRDILQNTATTFTTEENISEKYFIQKGDVLIGMDGNFHVNYWSKENCFLNQRVVRLRGKELANMYVRYQVEPYIKLREMSVSRTTVGHLSDKDLKAIFVLVPMREVRLQANTLFESSLEKIVANRQENELLSNFRDWLLPLLMNGQVTVREAYEQVTNVLKTPVAAEIG